MWDTFARLSRNERLFYLCGSARIITIVCGLFLLGLLRHQQARAQKGDAQAARAVLLPMFQPMILLLIASVAVEYFFLWWNIHADSEYGLVTMLAQFSLNCFSQTGLVTFFCSHSFSQQTLQRSFFAALWFAVFGLLCAVINAITRSIFYGSMLFNFVPLLFYLAILRGWMYRRKSIVPYLQFMLVYGSVWCVYTVVTVGWEDGPAYYVCLFAIAAMDLPRSFLWYVVLWSDTYYWRTGATKFNLHLKRSFWRVLRRLLCRSSVDLGPEEDETEKYERDAQERIAFLYEQEVAFEMRRRHKADATQHGMELAAGQQVDSPPMSISPSSPTALAASSVGSSIVAPSSFGETPPPPTPPPPPLTTLRQGGLPREALLISGSDRLLSREVQQLIELNKHRFIDFALLRVAEEGAWIGSGGMSNVYAAYYRNYPVALKFFKTGTTELTAESIAAYSKETALAASLKHPNIVTFIGLCVRPPSIFIVMELCAGGSLFSLLPQLKYHPAYTYQAVLAWCVQVTSSIVYLHERLILHRDIKSLNYLVTRNGEIKLTDFGLSRMFPAAVRPPNPTAAAASSPCSSSTSASGPPPADLACLRSLALTTPGASPSPSSPSSSSAASASSAPPPPPGSPSDLRVPLLAGPLSSSGARATHRAAIASHLLTRQVGSRVWMSPEQKNGDAYSFSSDVYSLSTVLWEILTCSAPFDDVTDEDLPGVLMRGQLPPIPDFTPDDFRDLLLRGWSREPAARPTASQMHRRLKAMLRAHERDHRLEPFDTSVFFRPMSDTHHQTPPPM